MNIKGSGEFLILAVKYIDPISDLKIVMLNISEDHYRNKNY
jgi:hypothetical protein